MSFLADEIFGKRRVLIGDAGRATGEDQAFYIVNDTALDIAATFLNVTVLRWLAGLGVVNVSSEATTSRPEFFAIKDTVIRL